MSEIHHHHHHQSLNREGHLSTTGDFATSFLHFSLFSVALWDLLNSRFFSMMKMGRGSDQECWKTYKR